MVIGYPRGVSACLMALSELRTYLNDHLAGSVGGLELARHAAGEHRGSELGRFLSGLAEELDEDRRALREIMDEFGAGVDHPKLVVSWLTEKATQVKFHSPLSSRGPLTTFLELEALHVGITGKLLMWRALADAWGEDERLTELIARAGRQRDEVERHRLEAGRDAL